MDPVIRRGDKILARELILQKMVCNRLAQEHLSPHRITENGL